MAQSPSSDSPQISKQNFLYPRGRYYGKFTPEYLAFNANLQEFAQKVSYVSALETGGKISSEQAYQQVRSLWKQLKHTKESLGIGQAKPPNT
ncbi:MAG: hypothetical protein RID09_04640 [Coleofasciculus sp. G1-WW12-02]|uniref:DUF7219 family protein n=1 Tax=Coleofasciculus sp. G1-WW12-02 TaxID=3068483 RepID=UPI0032F30662